MWLQGPVVDEIHTEFFKIFDVATLSWWSLYCHIMWTLMTVPPTELAD